MMSRMASMRAGARRWVAMGVAGLVALWAFTASGTSPAFADVTSVGGGAFGARVQSLSGSVDPPIPSVILPAAGGGPFTATHAGVSVPALTTGSLSVQTFGSLGPAGKAESTATVNSPSVSTNPPSASPLFSASAVSSSCLSNSSGSTGSTTITNGFVRGTAVPTTPAPNTPVNDPLFGNVTLNEQVVSNSPGATTITVNAVHVHRFPADDIILGQSRCEANGPNVNTTTTTTAPDSTPPTCTVKGVFAGPPKRMEVTVRDTGRGLAAITNIVVKNGSVTVAAFTPGTTEPVVVTATKTNPALPTTFSFDAVDVAGNVGHCR